MPKELISIIVPVYNVERYLEKCIGSLINQSYQNLEIILVDDGSVDRSGGICDAYLAKDPRIQVIHKKNGGLSDARNAGLEKSSGKWFAFIDSDDYITPDTIERLYLAATENNCQIAVCNMIRVYDNGETQPFYCPARELTFLEGERRFETLNQPSVCNKLFKADLFEGIQFPKGKYYEDTFVYHILAHRAQNIVLTGHDGYFYLSRLDSILGQPTYTDRYFDSVEAVYHRVTFLLEHQVGKYAEEACLSLYAAVATAERSVPKTKTNEWKFAQMHVWYQTAYCHLMKHPDIGIKQKLRLIILRYAPGLHNRIY